LVTIVGQACPHCAGPIVLTRGGTVSVGVADRTTKPNPELTGMALASLPLGGNEWNGQPVAIPAPHGDVGIAVTYRDGKRDFALLPNSGDGPLRHWAQTTALEATRAVMQPRWNAIADAIAHRTLRSVTLELLGCYGTCPHYTASFTSGGHALLHDLRATCNRVSTAGVPFASIIAAAAASNAQYLQPFYPRMVTDVLGARITLATPHASYVSFGPDRTRWDDTFSEFERRLDDIVRATTWHATQPCLETGI
jgi:hypothetical protein